MLTQSCEFIMCMQELIVKAASGRKKKFGAAQKAELKLLTVLVYFIVATVTGLAQDSYLSGVTPEFYLTALIPYFTCESNGNDPSRDCQSLLSNIQNLHFFRLSVAFILMIGLMPLVVFLFSIDFDLFIRNVKKLRCSK